MPVYFVWTTIACARTSCSKAMQSKFNTSTFCNIVKCLTATCRHSCAEQIWSLSCMSLSKSRAYKVKVVRSCSNWGFSLYTMNTTIHCIFIFEKKRTKSQCARKCYPFYNDIYRWFLSNKLQKYINSNVPLCSSWNGLLIALFQHRIRSYSCQIPTKHQT